MPTKQQPAPTPGKSRAEGRVGRAEVPKVPNEFKSRDIEGVAFIDFGPEDPEPDPGPFKTDDQALTKAEDSEEDSEEDSAEA